jgi:hypothetical protein
MTITSGRQTGLRRTTKVWAFGVMAGGLALVAGLFTYVEVLVRARSYVSVELVLALFAPYFLCGLIILLANGARLVRLFAGSLLASGLALDVFVAWEFTDTVVRTGGPPVMPASVFFGALILLGQYAATVLGIFIAWIYWMATPWQSPPPPTQEQQDYAD